MKLNMPDTVHAIIHSFGSKKLAPCKNVNWHLAIFLAPTFWEPEQPLGSWIYQCLSRLNLDLLSTVTWWTTLKMLVLLIL